MLHTGKMFNTVGCLHLGYYKFTERASLDRELFFIGASYEIYIGFICNFCFQFYHQALIFKHSAL